MASPTFTYRPLERLTTIRLLKIDSELEDGSISCTIEHFSENNAPTPEYIALSYCWGNTEVPPACHIRIRYKDDQTFHSTFIYANLWGLLDLLRISEERNKFYYWMDALCLDQKSENEKAKQVPRMGTIYSEALRTISWLGHPDTSETWLSFSIHRLPGWIEDKRLAIMKIFESVPASAFKLNFAAHDYTNSLPKKAKLSCFSVGIIHFCMKAMLSQPYWMRVWVIQEVALAKNVEIMFGALTLDFNDFLIAYKTWIIYMPAHSIRPAAVHARMMSLAGEISFGAIMEWGNACRSSKRLDRVYGLLGLIKYSELGASLYSKLLIADYKKTGGQLFWELVFGFELYQKRSTHHQLRPLANSLMTHCILDGEGLQEFLTIPTVSSKQKVLANFCTQAMPLFHALSWLFGWAHIGSLSITGFERSAWIQSWSSQVPAYKQTADNAELEESEFHDALRLGLACYTAGPTGDQADNKLVRGWHLLENHNSVASMSSDSILELYTPYHSRKIWGEIKQRMCTLYSPDSAGQSRFPHDPCLPPLGLELKQLGWKLKFEPSQELQEYTAGLEIPRKRLILGKLILDYGS